MTTAKTPAIVAAADSEYAVFYEALLQNITKLKAHAKKHAAAQAKDKGNWGFVGDVAKMNKAVLDALGESK